eukprot:CAMPEP_0196593608 /NCGR_PEP_ID=MMETSP1081-20130531/76075_1 /TAXON_ID=36882 /ORGANISM="Pyramimonas amylifera, Strain CCMP720" /LENGTH=139 /DNA_ID=CAMNT_0041917635 /DNA_START=89 /DNA_END=508 /DNA_ORIENTATION=-
MQTTSTQVSIKAGYQLNKSSRVLLSAARAPISASRRVYSLKVKAEKEQRTGFIEEDNSGRANIFAVEPKQIWLSSPSRDAAAQEGIGGAQGYIGIGIALVGVAAGLFVASGGVPDMAMGPDPWESENLLPLSYYLQNLQ